MSDWRDNLIIKVGLVLLVATVLGLSLAVGYTAGYSAAWNEARDCFAGRRFGLPPKPRVWTGADVPSDKVDFYLPAHCNQEIDEGGPSLHCLPAMIWHHDTKTATYDTGEPVPWAKEGK